MNIKILQINVDRARAAHDLAYATANKIGADMMIISEPNKKAARNRAVITDEREDVAIICLNKKIGVKGHRTGKGYVNIELEGMSIIGVYLSPNLPAPEYSRRLDIVMEEARRQRKKLILCGDLNAKSEAWGAPAMDSRGELVSEWIAALDLSVINDGTVPTFVRGQSSSHLDVTLSTRDLQCKIINWRVLLEESLSLHRYIAFEICGMAGKNEGPQGGKPFLNKQKLREEIRKALGEKDDIGDPEGLVKAIIKAQKRSQTYGNTGKIRPQPYWWNELIESKRIQATTIRRTITRMRKRKTQRAEEIEGLEQTLRQARKDLRRLIQDSQRRKWQDICQALNEDVYGEGYKIAVKSLKGFKTPYDLSEDNRRQIIGRLFPTNEDSIAREGASDNVELFTTREVLQASALMKPKKSPGPDRILPESVKTAAEVNPQAMAKVMNNLLLTQSFPACWKTANVCLLPKEKPNTYRPICLIDTLGKFYEILIRERLEKELDQKEILSNSQYGFRKGRSTVQAVNEVVRLTEGGKWTAAIMIDVKNAFNTAVWSIIVEKLRKASISKYLLNIITDYLTNRAINIGKDERLGVTMGVPQGSVLGPTLWNVLYNDVLKLEMEDGCKVIAYADDLALTVAAESASRLIQNANHSLGQISAWMEDHKLQLAPEKTEAVILNGGRDRGWITFRLNGVEIVPAKHVKYLGIWLDSRRNFGEHVKRTVNKTGKTIAALNKIMPNIRGPRYNKRVVLNGVVQSTILYGAPVWSPVMRYQKYANMLLGTQRRSLLRVIQAYRTVSSEAAQAVAGIPPIDLLVMERQRTYLEGGTEDEIRAAKRVTLEQWQERWSGQQTKAAWTRRIMRELSVWVECPHKTTGYYFTQFMTGHGCFQNYLKRIGKSQRDECRYCQGINNSEDSAEHTIFYCQQWQPWRADVYNREGDLTPENIIGKMCSNKGSWDTIYKFIVNVIEKKEEEERKSQMDD